MPKPQEDFYHRNKNNLPKKRRLFSSFVILFLAIFKISVNISKYWAKVYSFSPIMSKFNLYSNYGQQ